MAYRATLSNFLEELEGKQNNPKYLSGWSRALFPTTFLEKAVYLSMKSQSLSLYATPPPLPHPRQVMTVLFERRKKRKSNYINKEP